MMNLSVHHEPVTQRRNMRAIRQNFMFGRLGNKLFAIASTIGIARTHGLEPCIAPMYSKDKTLTIFKNIPFCAGDEEKLTVWNIPMFSGSITPEDASDSTTDVEVKGYGCSYTFFEDVEEEILSAFEFTDDLKKVSKEFMDNHKDSIKEDSIKVGIHFRRTDMISFGGLYGPFPGTDFYKHSMKIMREKYGPSVIFLVASDDVEWCKAQDFLQVEDVLFIDQSTVEDFAILKECDHMIIGHGTFAWWAAYLGASQKGGDVMYFQEDIEKPVKNKYFEADKFYLPKWTAVSNAGETEADTVQEVKV
eukprot:CAMPEP_0195518230 /NCGR_PEP_ID=MMETSP0794_2-20130614/12623_1 /TAXON_ID=515487 /ORGANISM="Stephanopyxis turris, Strain CCMP 815" /LENGTH=304 /DNA_ID=CAMNT_0040647165 /DNA_START=134 /DNA_END=1048 /DNA_ORIENTATION=-